MGAKDEGAARQRPRLVQPQHQAPRYAAGATLALTTPRPRLVRDVALIDLSRAVEPDGSLGEKASLLAWSLLSDLEPGDDVRLILGAAAWVTETFRCQLAESLTIAGTVQIEGTVRAVRKALRAYLEQSYGLQVVAR